MIPSRRKFPLYCFIGDTIPDKARAITESLTGVEQGLSQQVLVGSVYRLCESFGEWGQAQQNILYLTSGFIIQRQMVLENW